MTFTEKLALLGSLAIQALLHPVWFAEWLWTSPRETKFLLLLSLGLFAFGVYAIVRGVMTVHRGVGLIREGLRQRRELKR